MAGDKERCLEAGMDEYITKPIQPEKLSDLLELSPPATLTGKVLQLLEGDVSDLGHAAIELVNEEKP